MPIFEYVCAGCDHSFEAIVMGGQKASCPKCEGSDLKRQLSVFAVNTNGNGATTSAEPMGGCGSCGDPRGPGSCSIN